MRSLNLLLAIGFALFGIGLAGFAVLFGELTCEAGCAGTGPQWTQNRDAGQWHLYWVLGVAFAVVACAGALWARRGPFAWALASWALCVLVGAGLWVRVDVVSPNSATDLWPWLSAGLLIGLTAAITGRRRENQRGRGSFGLLAAVLPLVLATALVAGHLRSTTEPRLPIEAVVAKANDRFVPKPAALRSLSVDGLRFPQSATAGFDTVGGTVLEFGHLSGASLVFARGPERMTYILLAGTSDLSYSPSRTEEISVGNERRELRWINDGLLTFDRDDHAVIVSGTPVNPELARAMRQLAASL